MGSIPGSTDRLWCSGAECNKTTVQNKCKDATSGENKYRCTKCGQTNYGKHRPLERKENE